MHSVVKCVVKKNCLHLVDRFLEVIFRYQACCPDVCELKAMVVKFLFFAPTAKPLPNIHMHLLIALLAHETHLAYMNASILLGGALAG